MAILSKIRDRGMFLILIVGLALFAFVLDPTSVQNFFDSNKVHAIGEVNGEEISREEFAAQVEAYRSQAGSRVTQMQAVNTIWNGMVSEKIFDAQIEAAGIVVGEEDIWNATISVPEIQNSPLFRNEANLFDEERVKEYIANLRDEGGQAWTNWLATENSIKANLQRQMYTTLVRAGLGASLPEGERDYFYNNTKMDMSFVYVPFTTVDDENSKVSKEEIQNYLNDNKKRFKPEATRTFQFVYFPIESSDIDENDVKAEVGAFINDREEYSNAAKTTVTVAGLKSATDYEAFLNESRSDLGIDNGYKYKNQVPAEIADEVFDANIGDVVGPYKHNNAFKISKVVEKIQIADSVKSSHILVPYSGATRSVSLKTKEEAKKSADSIYALVRNNKEKFSEIADLINTDGTKGKGGDIGWVRKDQAFSPAFDKDFADFIYKNRTGSIQVVETAFGYHVIRIDEKKEANEAVRLATFARSIEASEATENQIFENAETLAAKLTDGGDINELVVEAGSTVNTAQSVKALDEMVPVLGNQRAMVQWAFERNRELNDVRRFDVDVYGKRGYVVAILTGKTEEDGIVVSSDLLTQIRPELINKKRAGIIADRTSGSTLEEIASSQGTAIRTAQGVNLASPLVTGVGNEANVVAAASTMPLDIVSDMIIGDKGVFYIKVTKRELPTELDNYENYRNLKTSSLQARSGQVFGVLEETAELEDYRALYY